MRKLLMLGDLITLKMWSRSDMYYPVLSKEVEKSEVGDHQLNLEKN